MKNAIKIGIYYLEKEGKKILDKESMIEELEDKIAELLESGEYAEL